MSEKLIIFFFIVLNLKIHHKDKFKNKRIILRKFTKKPEIFKQNCVYNISVKWNIYIRI